MQSIQNHSFSPTSPKRKILFGIVAVATAVLLLLLAGCTPEKAVPNVVGMTKGDAERVVKDNGFTVGNVTEQDSDTVAAGNVVSQDPKEGTNAKTGSAINLVVAKAVVKQVQVPNLIGMTQTQAEDALIALGLVPKAEDPVANDSAAPGKVFKQSVAAGNTVNTGTSVSFTVALGKEVVTVPNVVGQTKANALKTLSDASFNVDVVEVYNSNVAAGIVVSQNPNAKIQVVKGTTVTLAVSKGSAPAGKVQVPNLATYTLSQAQFVLNSAGLMLDAKGDLNGTATMQTPAAGTMVDKGSTVSVTFESVYQSDEG